MVVGLLDSLNRIFKLDFLYIIYLFSQDVNLSLIQKLNDYLLKSFKIDFTFLNIVNEKNMKKRLNLRKNLNRYDKFKYKFYNKVQKGYLEISKNDNKYQIVDSNLDISNNKTIIINKIKHLIK